MRLPRVALGLSSRGSNPPSGPLLTVMLYTPRTIAFLCELQHPPLVPDPGPIQKLHNRMFESGDPTYRSFNVTHEGAMLSNPTTRPDAVSSAAFLANRIVFREEISSLTVESFARRVREVTEIACELRGTQIFTAQQVTVRTLINPRHFRDSRGFLKEGMFGFGGEVADFGREPQLYGMRLVFPATKDEPQYFSLRIESFHNDPRSLFLENQGTFPPIQVGRGLDPIEGNVQATYAFVVERVLRFISNFDEQNAEEA